MGRGSGVNFAAASPSVAPVAVNGGVGLEREHQLRNFDNSVNAVSFGFVATAILISMFLIMAIFERFLRPRSSDSVGGNHPDGGGANMRKLDYPSPKMTVYPRGVSVLMPGERIPTFLAHLAPAPSPCPRESISPAYTPS